MLDVRRYGIGSMRPRTRHAIINKRPGSKTGRSRMATAWKMLSGTKPINGGCGEWHRPHGRNLPGKWMPKITDLEPCVRGYHVCDDYEDLLNWLGPDIWVCEWRGLSVRSSSKRVVEQARLIRHADRWNEQSARLFAADCAEHVLPVWEAYTDDDRPRLAIAAARAYARGEIGLEELDAARAAAEDAAWAAARAAAGAAAGAATWGAAWAATRDAARDAERVWQAEQLRDLIGDL